MYAVFSNEGFLLYYGSNREEAMGHLLKTSKSSLRYLTTEELNEILGQKTNSSEPNMFENIFDSVVNKACDFGTKVMKAVEEGVDSVQETIEKKK